MNARQISHAQPVFSLLERTGTIAHISPAAVQCQGIEYDARMYSVAIYPHAVDLQPADPHDPWPVPAVVLTVRAAGGGAVRLAFQSREVRALIAALTDAGQQSLDRINDLLDCPREPFGPAKPCSWSPNCRPGPDDPHASPTQQGARQ